MAVNASAVNVLAGNSASHAVSHTFSRFFLKMEFMVLWPLKPALRAFLGLVRREFHQARSQKHRAAEGAGVLLLRNQGVFGAEFWGSKRSKHP